MEDLHDKTVAVVNYKKLGRKFLVMFGEDCRKPAAKKTKSGENKPVGSTTPYAPSRTALSCYERSKPNYIGYKCPI